MIHILNDFAGVKHDLCHQRQDLLWCYLECQGDPCVMYGLGADLPGMHAFAQESGPKTEGNTACGSVAPRCKSPKAPFVVLLGG